MLETGVEENDADLTRRADINNAEFQAIGKTCKAIFLLNFIYLFIHLFIYVEMEGGGEFL